MRVTCHSGSWERTLGSGISVERRLSQSDSVATDWIGLPLNTDAAKAALDRMASSLGYGYFLVARFPETAGTTLAECILSTNWPAALRSAYDAANLFGRSRIVTALRSSVKPVRLGSQGFLSLSSPSSNAPLAFDRAGFGETVAFTMHSADRCKFVFLLTSSLGNDLRKSPQEAMEAAVGIIDFLAGFWRPRSLAAHKPLSARELECLRWSADGKTTEDIATILGLSAYTVGDYIKTAMTKLDANSRMQAVARAIRDGLI